MKKLIILILFNFCFRSIAQVSDPDYNRPFSQLKAEKETYFLELVNTYGPEIIEGEASEYREYQRWLAFWEPRIAPNATYQSYNQNLRSYWDIMKSTKSFGNLDDWKELGPFTKPNSGITSIGLGGGQLGVGIIQSININRLNPNKVLGNSLAGGLFFSSNKGVNWTNAGSDKWFRSGCSAATFAPDNETTWYAGSNMGGSYYRNSIGSVGGVYRTTNAGLTWDIIADRSTFNTNPLIGEGTKIHKIIIDPKNPNIGYLATDIGLYKCININALSVSSISWSLVHLGSIEDIEFTTDNSTTSTLIISFKNAGIWGIDKSTDQAITWISLPSPPLSTSTNAVVLEVSDASPTSLYVLNIEVTKGIWVVDLITNSWTAKKQNIINTTGQHCFAVSNFNANVIYVGNHIYFDKSVDGGVSFTQVNTTQYHNDVEDVITPYATCTTCSQEVYVSTHGGVNYSSDQTSTLQSRSVGLGLASINGGSGSQSNPEKIAMGIDHDGSVISSGVYGSSWIPSWEGVYGGDGGQALIDYSNANNVWVESQQAPHLLSQTGGGAYTYTFTSFSNTNDFYNKIAQNQFYPEIVYSKSKTHTGIGLFEDIFRSNNRGIGVVEQISDFNLTHGLPTQHFIFGMFPSQADPNFMYLTEDQNLTYTSHLYRNMNMLAPASTVVLSWNELQLPHPNHYNSMTPDLINPNIVYITYGGNSWSYAQFYIADYTIPSSPVFTDVAGTLGSGGLPNTRIGTILLEKGSNGGIYVSTDIGVFYTNKSMINLSNPSTTQWIRLGSSLPNIPINSMDINYTANKLRVYTNGRGVWEHDLVCPSDLSFNFSGIQNTTTFYEAVNEIKSTAIINSTNSITYRAGTFIQIDPGFMATPTSSNFFSAFIHPCSYYGNSPGIKNFEENSFSGEYEENKPVKYLNSKTINIYPNPNDGKFTIDLDETNSNSSLLIYNLYGQVVAQFSDINDRELEIDISELPKGMYLVKCYDKSSVKTATIVCK